MLSPFWCLVIAVPDGDGLRCKSGETIRLAAINAAELHGAPCPKDRPCPLMSGRQAKATLEQMVLGRTLKCRPVGTSYRRIVADCEYGRTTVSCALVRVGAAAWWQSYADRYRLRPCHG
jgi:endonuclease YncB( thermonuclease family)